MKSKHSTNEDAVCIIILTGHYSKKGNTYYKHNFDSGWYFNTNERDVIRRLTKDELIENESIIDRYYLMKYRD